MEAPAATAPARADFSIPYRHPYHLGLYLAVNAIPRCYAIIDGPDCLYRKAEWVHGTHDIRSTLLDVLGNHRIVSTLMNAEGVIKSVGDEVVKRIRRVGKIPTAEIALVCSMPHVMIIGTQYDRLIAAARSEVPFPIFEVPSRSLEGDWLTGYAETLTAIAAGMDISGARTDPGKVAVIGYLMDRTEQDHIANVEEIERMLRALDLDIASVWLSNRPYAHLRAAADAGTLIALPHGVAAARALARRTGADVLEVGVPFGLGRTQRFLRRVADRLGRQDQAERFIAAELARLVPRLEWAIPRMLLGKTVAFSGDPTLFGGMVQIAEEVGMEVVHLSATARAPDWAEDFGDALGAPPPTYYAPPCDTLRREFGALMQDRSVDLLIANTYFWRLQRGDVPPAVLELGFPSQRRHALFDAPFFGFNGWMCFMNDIVRVLSEAAG